MMHQQSEVREFYKGKTLLVTGTTGFVGKVLLEKIIRSLTEVKRIYLLMRTRPNMTLMQRMNEQIFSTPVFDRLWKERPDL